MKMSRLLFFKLLLTIVIFITNPILASEYEDDDFSMFEGQIISIRSGVYDPLEPLNRKIFEFNNVADRYVIGYVVKGYRVAIPKIVRKGIGNFFFNITLPFSAINSFAQGKFDNGMKNISSFIINSTVGILGIKDVARREGIQYENEDFGQTMGYYNIGNGPYLVLPFLGPSTARSFAGDITRRAISPIQLDAFNTASKTNLTIDSKIRIYLTVLNAVDKKEQFTPLLDNIKKESFDPYVTVRSYFLQNLNNKINR